MRSIFPTQSLVRLLWVLDTLLKSSPEVKTFGFKMNWEMAIIWFLLCFQTPQLYPNMTNNFLPCALIKQINYSVKLLLCNVYILKISMAERAY